MRSFRQLLFEDPQTIQGWVGVGDKLELKKSSGKMDVFFIYTKKDRMAVRDEVVKAIHSSGYKHRDNYVSTSGIPAIEVDLGKTIRIFIKPIGGGGMNETTLNSTITEVVPCLMFYYGWSHSMSNDALLKAIVQAGAEGLRKAAPAFLGKGDMDAAIKFINMFEESSRLQEKLDNAKAIFKYVMKDLLGGKKVTRMAWGYRAKPPGVNPKHPGDIFVWSGDMLVGVSLKAGGKKTKEPQLNTSVNQLLGFFGEKHRSPLYRSMEKGFRKMPIFDKKFTYTGSWSNEQVDLLRSFEKQDQKAYDKAYIEMQLTIKDNIAKWFSADVDQFDKFVEMNILKKDVSTPTVVVKATGSTAHEVQDQNVLEAVVAFPLKGVRVRKAAAKADLHVDLIDKNGKPHTMLFSVRTNKPLGHNKVIQGFNLAVKYNGLK